MAFLDRLIESKLVSILPAAGMVGYLGAALASRAGREAQLVRYGRATLPEIAAEGWWWKGWLLGSGAAIGAEAAVVGGARAVAAGTRAMLARGARLAQEAVEGAKLWRYRLGGPPPEFPTIGAPTWSTVAPEVKKAASRTRLLAGLGVIGKKVKRHPHFSAFVGSAIGGMGAGYAAYANVPVAVQPIRVAGEAGAALRRLHRAETHVPFNLYARSRRPVWF